MALKIDSIRALRDLVHREVKGLDGAKLLLKGDGRIEDGLGPIEGHGRLQGRLEDLASLGEGETTANGVGRGQRGIEQQVHKQHIHLKFGPLRPNKIGCGQRFGQAFPNDGGLIMALRSLILSKCARQLIRSSRELEFTHPTDEVLLNPERWVWACRTAVDEL